MRIFFKIIALLAMFAGGLVIYFHNTGPPEHLMEIVRFNWAEECFHFYGFISVALGLLILILTFIVPSREIEKSSTHDSRISEKTISKPKIGFFGTILGLLSLPACVYISLYSSSFLMKIISDEDPVSHNPLGLYYVSILFWVPMAAGWWVGNKIDMLVFGVKKVSVENKNKVDYTRVFFAAIIGTILVLWLISKYRLL